MNDGMLSASMTTRDLFIGEMLFAGTKGLFFSSAVLIVISSFGLSHSPLAVSAPLVGFITAVMLAALALYITSFVKDINHFNFYFTGVIMPMFFFSGVVFPFNSLSEFAQWIAAAFRLSHAVNLVRALCFGRFSPKRLLDLLYVAVLVIVFGQLAIKRLT